MRSNIGIRIQRHHIRSLSKSLLEVLKKEEIYTLTDTDKLKGRKIEVTEGLGGIVEAEMSAPYLGRESLTISYKLQDTGIPIEIKIRTPLYIMVIIKATTRVEGYEPFMEDAMGNIMQNKLLPLDWPEAIKEL